VIRQIQLLATVSTMMDCLVDVFLIFVATVGTTEKVITAFVVFSEPDTRIVNDVDDGWKNVLSLSSF
jgi:hypothetical protein